MTARLWSTTPGSNNGAVPAGAPEGMAPGGVNNVIRQVMADARDTLEQLPYFDFGDTPTRVDNDTFTVPADLTARYTVGRRLKLVGATTGYATISASTFTTLTTVDVTMDSGNVPTSLVTVSLGLTGVQGEYIRTPAEIAASVTPVNYFYVPGDIRRYGALSGPSNVAVTTTAWANAVAQYAQGGAPVYVPTVQGTGWFVSAGATINGAIKIVGDKWDISTIQTTSDITVLTVTNGANSLFENVAFLGKGAGATLPGLKLTDCQRTVGRQFNVSGFSTGIKIVGSVGGSFSCSFHDCRMVSNLSIGLDAGSNTNDLVIIGGAYASNPTGIKIVDSQRAAINTDVEACTVVGIDLDATVADARGQCGHVINATDFENNITTGGNIRIGNTALVRGVTVIGGSFSPGAGDSWAINPVNSRDLTVIGSQLIAGYTNDVWIRIAGANNDAFTAIGIKSAAGVTTVHGGEVVFSGSNSLATGNEGTLTLAQVTITYSASITIDVSHGNEYTISVTNGTAFTINAPTNPQRGKRISLWIINSSGGAMGAITWNAVFKMSAWTNPANTQNRTIDFIYSGSTWYEASRTPNDVPN